MGAAGSVPTEVPESIEAAKEKGFTDEQIDAYFAPPQNNSRFGGTIDADDAKNTEEFRYFKYPALPVFVRDGESCE